MNKKKVNLQKNKFVSARSSKQKINKNKRTESSRRWLSRQLNDPYVSEAQKRGFRSRSAFKLLQIDEKFHLFKSGMNIIDLGCAPGGWLQVISEIINKNKKGKIIGIDLLETDALPNVEILVGDINDQKIIDQVNVFFNGEKVNGVVSDMAADTTGNRSLDCIRTNKLCADVIEFSSKILKPKGVLISKLFMGDDFLEVKELAKSRFKKVEFFKPKASRSESKETYIHCAILKTL